MKHYTKGESGAILKLQTILMELMMVVVVGGIAACIALAFQQCV